MFSGFDAREGERSAYSSSLVQPRARCHDSADTPRTGGVSSHSMSRSRRDGARGRAGLDWTTGWGWNAETPKMLRTMTS